MGRLCPGCVISILLAITAGQQVPAEELVIGSQVLIRPGDRAPADGMVMGGASRMDESMLTGEPAPISKKSADKVLSMPAPSTSIIDLVLGFGKQSSEVQQSLHWHGRLRFARVCVHVLQHSHSWCCSGTLHHYL